MKFKETFYFSCGILFPVSFSSFLAYVRSIDMDNLKTFYQENLQTNTKAARIVSQIPMGPSPSFSSQYFADLILSVCPSDFLPLRYFKANAGHYIILF